ncbi:MAG: rhodanese-like domain-containing protein [Steroidobacteraceae bacterium]
MEKLPEYIATHPWLVAMAALAALLVLVYEIRIRRDSFAAISPQDLIRLQNQGALVLDIRKPEDHAAGHIAGSRQMDSHELVKASDSLKKYKEKPVVIYCYSGSTGASAARVLNGQGFTQVFNLRGGIGGWQTENLPVARGKNKA